MKKLFLALTLSISLFAYAQETKSNSDTRKFIDNADFTQINKDWSQVAEFKSGLGEVVSFFPVEAINLKTNEKIKSLQMDMNVIYKSMGKTYNYYKNSWIDIEEIDAFIFFIEEYIIPNIEGKTDNKQSVTYLFNSKEIGFNFRIEKNRRRISIFLKDHGITDHEHYFWTESQVNKIPALLVMLKAIK